MSRIAAALVATMLVSSTATAQQIASIDLSALGFGILSRPLAIDTDGNPQTEEWLVTPIFSASRRVVAVRNGVFCVGPMFQAGPDWSLDTVRGRTVLARLVWPHFDIMTLDTPVCP